MRFVIYKRKLFITFAIIAFTILLSLSSGCGVESETQTLSSETTTEGKEASNNNGINVTLYKSPTCGCCGEYTVELENYGFNVEVIKIEDMQSIRDKYGISEEMESCHTMIIGDYFVEGHMPFEAIEKLLSEKPDIDGIALPDMPSGTIGMPGEKREEWIIYSLKDNQIFEFMRI